MLKASIRFEDLNAPVEMFDGGFLLGDSRIVPFGHRLLRAEALVGPGLRSVIVRERTALDDRAATDLSHMDDDGVEAALAALETFPLDWLTVTWAAGGRSVRFACSYWGLAPIYLRGDLEGVEASWSPGDLLRGEGLVLDGVATARFLAGSGGYGADIVVAGLRRLTAASTVVAEPGRLTVRYPPASPGVVPADLAAGEDPVTLLLDATAALMEFRPLRPDRTAVEVSGGMDSAITSLVAARAFGPGLLSYGAVFEGAMGEAQVGRRALIVETGRMADLAAPAIRLAPYGETSPRRRPLTVWPHDENYPEIFEPMIAFCAASGVDALITGSGGDELYPLYPHERGARGGADRDSLLTEQGRSLAAWNRDGYPFAGVLDSAWTAAAARSERLLRYGIWPVYPFHSRLLTQFTFRLPAELRHDRRLHRMSLTRLTGDACFETDYVKETFGPTLNVGLERNRDFVGEVVAEARSVALGLVDGPAARALAARPPETLTTDERDTLFFLLNFETFVRGQATRLA
jgi:asparagine synthase (glutamine-hydrolysing)